MGNCCAADQDHADIKVNGPSAVGAGHSAMPTPQPDDNIQKYTNDTVSQLTKQLGKFDPGAFPDDNVRKESRGEIVELEHNAYY